MHRRTLLAGLGALLPAPGLRAQGSWPDRPVRIVVPYGPGGAGDILARVLAQALAGPLRQPVVVENRPGGNTIIAAEHVARSAPDGHTLLVCASATLSTAPILYGARLPYDPERHFQPISRLSTTPYFVFVGRESPARSLADVMEAARARPEALLYGSIGNGSVGHITSEWLTRQAGVKMTHAVYRSYVTMVPDLIANRFGMVIADAGVFAGPIRSGDLRAVAAMLPQRSGFLPDAPSLPELDYPAFDGSIWFGVLGPAGLPAGVVERLDGLLAGWLATAAAREALANIGQVPGHLGPEALRSLVRSDTTRFGVLIREFGITAEL